MPRSVSGPGLSINTNSAITLSGSSAAKPTSGMFGNTANKPGGLFGTSASTAPQTTGLFGTSATTQPATGSLFGTSTSLSTTGGLFGSTATKSQPPAAGGLFGSTATTSQPPAAGGLFGSTATTSQPQTGVIFGTTAANTQSQQASGLFTNTTASQPAQTGGLFGATTSQPAQTGGLFGNHEAQAKPAGSLFGNTLGGQTQQSQPQAQQSAFGPGIFGNTLSGGLSLGQSTNQQQTVPGVLIDTSNIRGTTRFNDLKEELQKQIIDIDNMIQNQIQLKNDCGAIMPAHDAQLAQVPIDVEFCERKRIGVDSAADSDIQAISIVQKLTKTDAEAARLSFSAIDILRLPPQYHTSGIWSQKSNENRANDAEDIVGFFSKTADELASTLSTYQKYIAEIEQHLRSVEATSAQQINALVARKNGSVPAEETPYEQLAGVLRDFEAGLLSVAAKVGDARKGVATLELGQFQTTSVQTHGQRNGVF